jgi:hypothetical protein
MITFFLRDVPFAFPHIHLKLRNKERENPINADRDTGLKRFTLQSTDF